MHLTDRLPRWQSHKLVRAAKIARIDDAGVMELAVTDDQGAPVAMRPSERMFARYRPVAGDYYVVHDDGHAAVMPAASFEAGYHKL